MLIEEENQELKELYMEFDDNFRKLSSCDNDDLIEKFSELAEKIIKYNKINCIKFLLKYFNDNDEGYNDLDWLQDNLKNIIETVDDELYVTSILMNLQVMFPHVKNWAKYLISRIINNPSCQIIFEANIHLADQAILNKITK